MRHGSRPVRGFKSWGSLGHALPSQARPRIAILAPTLHRLWARQGAPTGGTDTQMAAIARGLSRDHDVVVVTGGPADEPLQAPAGIRVLRIAEREPGQSVPAAAAGWARSVRTALRQTDPDWVLQLGVSYLTLVAALWCKAHRRRFAFLWGSVADANGRDTGKPAGAADRLLVWARRRADLQVCQTEQQMALLGPRERRHAVVVPNPLNADVPWRQADGDADAVLWVGWLRPVKRPDLFLRVAGRLPHRRFVMAGAVGGDAAFRAQTEEAIRRTPNVRLLGFVPEPGLPDVYAQARVLLNTSDIEGFPNTFLEAMACGVPVVSLRFDPNGILAAGAGVCADGDEERLVAAVERMFGDEAAFAACRAAALRTAEQHRPERIVSRLAAALRQAGGP